MREIKFRAWDKLKKIMVTKENVDDLIEKFDDWEDENDPYCRKEWYPAHYIKGIFTYFDDIQHYEPFLSEDMKDRFEVMQYTGLKDKNGKEIYEGDIVKVEKIDLSYIYYDEDRMAWGIKPINEFYFDSPLLSENADLEIEVIGNIYDNPDLLEKGKEE